MSANVEAIRARVMEAATHYATLEVPPKADEAALKAAHRGLARLFHPDIAPGAENTAAMAKVNVAYNVLTDAPARRKYDALHKTDEQRCRLCDGTGVTYRQKGFNKRVQAVCSVCAGSGWC